MKRKQFSEEQIIGIPEGIRMREDGGGGAAVGR